LGNEVTLFSSVGNDPLGAEARHRLKSIGLPEEQLQVRRNYPTGTAEVELNANGDASFNMRALVAWDDLLWTDEWRSVVPRLDAIYFGSLCQRSEESHRTIQQLLDHTSGDCVRVFDVNLRSPFYSASVLQSSIERATILKLNEDELPIVMELLGFSKASSIEQYIADLFNSFKMKLIAVTYGSHGSLVASRENSHRHCGISVPVEDTVGAGDAFTAALTSYYLRGAPIQILNEAGNVWGSWVASQTGAMPDCPAETHDRLTRRITESIELHSSI
jgi:fructokinase